MNFTLPPLFPVSAKEQAKCSLFLTRTTTLRLNVHKVWSVSRKFVCSTSRKQKCLSDLKIFRAIFCLREISWKMGMVTRNFFCSKTGTSRKKFDCALHESFYDI